ncbi:DNA recombination protein RmuC [Sphingomonas sp. ASV193]|uniref:DNA recombination protein RmuC n=1 Tax=Sphingomonas sp. ASV193 TaxID=3144405 RepID=UPI0032E91CF8
MMVSSVAVIGLVLVALLVGAAIGWLVGQRGGEQGKAVAESLRMQLDAVTSERESARAETGAVRAELAAVGGELAALKAAEGVRAEKHAEQVAQLVAIQDGLRAQFAEVSGKLLENAQKQFLDRADQRFRESEATSGNKIKALLQPVHDRLQRYEEAVGKVEEERRKDFGLLTGHIEAMKSGTERVSAEAAKLVNALRNAPKARGRWGEQQLRNVLESCGLSEHCDFQTEVSRDDGEGGRLRPDVIVRVPGGQNLVIDAKVSLNSYQDAFGAVDEAERERHLALHAAAIKAHVNALGNKAYWAQFADAPDYVVMFIPGEHFLSAALEQDGTLWDFAFRQRVLLATPTNLIAIARTVAAVWRQERLAKEARQIGELGKELYERLAKAAGDLRKVGSGLTSAVNNYNSFVASFEGRSLVTARKFRDLNIEPGAREIEEVGPVEVLARYGDDRPALPSASNEDDAAA